MHVEAFEFVSLIAKQIALPYCIVEIGSRDVNGSVRCLFPNSAYVGVDQWPGDGVDVVADGATWRPVKGRFDLVICCETLEHAADPLTMLRNLVELANPGAFIVVTAAGPDRPKHSAIDGGPLQRGEPYQPITIEMVEEGLAGCKSIAVGYAKHLTFERGDIHAVAIR